MEISRYDFGLFITWTTYGTWLPGDARGHVSNFLDEEYNSRPKQNTPGTPYRPGDRATYARAARLQKQATVYLNTEEAQCVASALLAACATRLWHILQAAIMANHVHVVVVDCPDDGPQVRRILKGVTQSALSERNGAPRRWWTQNGSDRYLHGQKSLLAASQYVANQHAMLAAIQDGELF